VKLVNQKAALALGALTGAAAALLLGRRQGRHPMSPPPAGDRRGDELRRDLAEAREAGVDEGEFHAAGMGAETIIAEEGPRGGAPPANEFEAMRRRVHEEARAAADEMRRQAETTE
jgi:hypothetical protein